MKYVPFLSLFLLLSTLSHAQTIVATFENFGLSQNSFINQAASSEGFVSGNVSLDNEFDPMFNSWNGWAISSETDISTPGFMNQYSAITGSGHDNSLTYATAFTGAGGSRVRLLNGAQQASTNGVWVTNSTYAYLSMLEGDAFAKRFGGETGDDPDFFLLTIKGYQNGELTTDSIDFYLADYRFDDNSSDYLIDEWTFVDLSSLGQVDSMHFSLSSSDIGSFGMNTPAYFCIDDFETSDGIVQALEASSPVQHLYPNPATTVLYFNPLQQAQSLQIYNLAGQVVLQERQLAGSHQINIQQLNPGYYFLHFDHSKFPFVKVD